MEEFELMKNCNKLLKYSKPQKYVISQVGQGEIIGEMDLFYKNPSSITATCIS